MKHLTLFSSQNTLRHTHDEAFPEDDDDDWIFDPALDPVMVGGGGASANPLLEFDLQPVGARRNWRNALNKQRYEATLRQQRDSTPNDNIGQELTHALRRSIQRQIDADNTLTPHSTVHFTMQSSAFTHAFQSTTFTVREFVQGSERLDTYLQTLAAKLNSNEEFAPDDTFSMETTFIHTPGPGSGHGKRYKPSCAAVRGIAKKSRITIKNKDNLCCARAIVTMKALADADGNTRNQEYQNLKQGRPVQERLAKELHQQAGVPEGPCATPELTRFQAALPNHQIKVVSIDPPHMIIFAGNPATPTGKIIRLIKEDGHYDGCNSFAGFLSKSYFLRRLQQGIRSRRLSSSSLHRQTLHLLQTLGLSQFPRRQTTPTTWTVPLPNLRLPPMSPQIFRRPVLQLPPAASESPPQIHLRLPQEMPRLLSRVRPGRQSTSWR